MSCNVEAAHCNCRIVGLGRAESFVKKGDGSVVELCVQKKPQKVLKPTKKCLHVGHSASFHMLVEL